MSRIREEKNKRLFAWKILSVQYGKVQENLRKKLLRKEIVENDKEKAIPQFLNRVENIKKAKTNTKTNE